MKRRRETRGTMFFGHWWAQWEIRSVRLVARQPPIAEYVHIHISFPFERSLSLFLCLVMAWRAGNSIPTTRERPLLPGTHTAAMPRELFQFCRICTEFFILSFFLFATNCAVLCFANILPQWRFEIFWIYVGERTNFFVYLTCLITNMRIFEG